jgi:hypothetical protein
MRKPLPRLGFSCAPYARSGLAPENLLSLRRTASGLVASSHLFRSPIIEVSALLPVYRP